MENKSNKKISVSRRVSTCLAAALFVVGILGFYAFMPYPNGKASGKIAGLMNIADSWKTYSNSYLTFKYPDTYKISDEEQEEDSYKLCCEIKGDDLSILNISVTEMGDMSGLSDSFRDLTLEMGVSAGLEELQNTSYYKNLVSTDIKKVTKGYYSGMSSTFTTTIFGVSVQGEIFMAYSGERLLTVVAQAENARYMSQLNQIVEGIKVK